MSWRFRFSRPRLGIAVALALAGAAYWSSQVPSPPRPPEVPRVRIVPSMTPLALPANPLRRLSDPITTPVPAASPLPDPRRAGSPLAAELHSLAGSPARDVQVLHEMLRQYLRHLHHRQGRPIGNDSDLLHVLTGHNPMKLIVLPPHHPAAGADGRLRDRWDTPYFVHPRGNNAFEIRSAGPDRRLFTADDLVANPGPRREVSAAQP